MGHSATFEAAAQRQVGYHSQIGCWATRAQGVRRTGPENGNCRSPVVRAHEDMNANFLVMTTLRQCRADAWPRAGYRRQARNDNDQAMSLRFTPL